GRDGLVLLVLHPNARGLSGPDHRSAPEFRSRRCRESLRNGEDRLPVSVPAWAAGEPSGARIPDPPDVRGYWPLCPAAAAGFGGCSCRLSSPGVPCVAAGRGATPGALPRYPVAAAGTRVFCGGGAVPCVTGPGCR